MRYFKNKIHTEIRVFLARIMIVRLLPSEICRLNLNYFEEENLLKSYEAFLNECKYLEEYRLYLERGIGVPKTIHGKTLKEYLVIENAAETEKKLLGNKIPLVSSTQSFSNQPVDEHLNQNSDRSVKRKLDISDGILESIIFNPLTNSTNDLSSQVAHNLSSISISRTVTNANLNDSDIIILDTSDNLPNSVDPFNSLNNTSPTESQQCPTKKPKSYSKNQSNYSQIETNKNSNSPAQKKKRVYNRITPTIRTIIENTSSNNTDTLSNQNSSFQVDSINQLVVNSNQSANSLGDILLMHPIMTKSVLGKQQSKS